MNTHTIYFLFIVTGIFSTAIAYTANNILGNTAYATEERYYEQGYKKSDSSYDNNYDRDYGNNGYDKGYNYGKDRDYGGGGGSGGYDGYGKQEFVAKLNGENVKPNPTDSPITGFAKVKVAEKSYNGEKKLIYELSVFGVPKGDDLIAAHIHVIADPQTQLGPHIVTLCGQPINEKRCTEGPGVIAKGIATNEDIETEEQDIITNIDELIDALEEGRGYIQIHSTQFPEGAVRGDLIEK